MLAIPKVRLGNSDVEVTRLMVGGNPLCGNSHYTPEMNTDMREYFTPEQVVKFLHEVQATGINTLQARGDFHRVLFWRELFTREGGDLRFVCQTASEMADLLSNIRVIAATGAEGIYHHGTRTDNLWLDGKIDEVKDALACMRDSGVQVGLGSHIPEVFDYAEDKGWDVDFYMTCFYNLNRSHRESALVDPFNKGTFEEFRPEDPERMIQFIQATDKMCLAFKILAANRKCQTQEDVRKAFEFAFENIKPKDAVVVGMFPKYEDQVRLNAEHTIAAIESASSTRESVAAD